MSFYHIVGFAVSGGQSAVDSLTNLFLALEHDVKRDGKTIIKSVKGGKQVSKEGFDHDVKVVWIMEFESDADLQYYLWEDKAHEEFKQALGKFENVRGNVLDFQEGVY